MAPLPLLKGFSLTSSSLAKRRKDSLHLWSPPPLFLSYAHLRILPSQRRLPWRPLLLFHVALCRISPLFWSRLGGHDAHYLRGHPDRRQAKKGIRLEDIGWTAFSLWIHTVCCDGDNSEFHRQGLEQGSDKACRTVQLIRRDRPFSTTTMTDSSLGGNSIYHGYSARSAGV